MTAGPNKPPDIRCELWLERLGPFEPTLALLQSYCPWSYLLTLCVPLPAPLALLGSRAFGPSSQLDRSVCSTCMENDFSKQLEKDFSRQVPCVLVCVEWRH